MTTFLALLACAPGSDTGDTSDTGSHSLPAVESGTLSVCLDGAPSTEGDVTLDFDGTLTGVGVGTCGYEITIEGEDAITHVVGVDAEDATGVALLPDLSAEVGGAVQLRFRSRLVWGTVSGFALFDDTGLVLAAEEGTWGGALYGEDLSGLVVSRGAVVAQDEDSCQDHAGTSVVFTADDVVTLVPVDQGPLTVAGSPLTAFAIAAWDYAQNDTCTIDDATGFLTWMVSR